MRHTLPQPSGTLGLGQSDQEVDRGSSGRVYTSSNTFGPHGGALGDPQRPVLPQSGALNLVEGGFISIGWEELGDLSGTDVDRERLKLRLAETYPTAKPGAIPVWAGVLYRFIAEMQIGDYVISPNKADRTLNFGIIDSDFYVEHGEDVHGNRRRVRWIKTDVPRDDFTKGALHEIGSAVTLFKVKNHASEFLNFLQSGSTTVVEGADEDEVDLAEDEPNAERVDTYSRDYVVGILRLMDAYRFEHFVAGLLQAMGYRASATVASGDGGVDVMVVLEGALLPLRTAGASAPVAPPP